MTIMTGFRDRIASRVWIQLVTLLGATLLAASTVLLVLVIGFYYQRLSATQDNSAEMIGDLLQTALEKAMLARDIPALQGTVDALSATPTIAEIAVLDRDRRIRFTSGALPAGGILQPDQPAGQDGFARIERPVPNQPACESCHGAVVENPVNGFLVVDYAVSGIMRDTLVSAVGLVVLGGLVTLAASTVLALGLRRIVVRPVKALGMATEQMAAGDLSSRVAPDPGGNEISALGRSFNQMAENIEAGQAALTRSERMSQALIDAIPDGIRVIGPDFRILRANAAYGEQTGRPLSEIIGQPCYASSHGRDEPCPYTLVTCPVAEMRKTARHLTFRDVHLNPDGVQIPVEVSAAPMEDCVVEAIRNLDEQARISQAQRLSEIGLLATGVAHEIHNPLSSMELALDRITRDLAQGRDDKAQEYFPLIRGEIAKCLEITDNLMRLGGPAEEGQQLVDLRRAVTGVTGLLSFEAERRGVSVAIDISDELRVLIAEADLLMAISNLALNAIHAMPGGGVLTLSGRRSEARILLEVCDTGVGIPAQDINDIFMPFWSRRADETTGRGLGLAITRAIVDRANARISVESAPGQGSRFTISFPDPDAAS
ncbi:ATP-binding protein [Paracoccus sp. SCSIO 75233]|uniref:sensor histidine kinase n=1 Tax=Paracoccus sp. SCSIO 75233 TaxID=3017782 RepID=UPI0022F00AA3|nr:ATP-binding protein [Paracoccus sp. SCSIO 75233]WBU54210.1 ATP-binding protein [Paracoccus sp. SCSIO 75233]